MSEENKDCNSANGDFRKPVSIDGKIDKPDPGKPFPKWAHVVSIAVPGVVKGYRWKRGWFRRKTKYFKTVKKSARMANLHPLNEDACFKDEQAVMAKAFTGIILKHPNSSDLYVLTAGHVFPGKNNPEKYRFALYDFLKRYHSPRSGEASWWMSINYNLSSFKMMIASYGGARSPDFAICKLSRRQSKSIKGYQVSEGEMKGIKDNPKGGNERTIVEAEYYFHPNGLGLKKAQHQTKTMDRGKMWEGSPYVFCPLQVTDGCSGTPVFHKVGGEDRFLGIVVSKGNPIPDFDKYGNWQFKCDKGYNGTKILTLEGIRSYLYSLSDHPDWDSGNKKRTLDELKSIFPEFSPEPGTKSWWDKREKTTPEPSHTGTLDGPESLYMEGKKLNYSGEGSDGWSIELSKDESVTLKFEGKNFQVFKGKALIPNNFPDLAADVKAKDLKKFDWPIAQILPSYNLTLRFVDDLQMKVCDVFPELNQVVALEGIGTMDIIDELPERHCQRLQRAWVCDGHYIELKLSQDEKKIRISHVDGMVDVFSQAFKPTFTFKMNPG